MDLKNEPLSGRAVVVIAPHPDDESLATGGFIQHALEAGAAVSVLVLTDGDCNPWPQRVVERRLRIRPADRERWGARRRAEASRALSVLGVGEQAVHFVGWPDMGITDRLARSGPEAVRTLSQLLAQSLAHSGGYGVVAIPSLNDRHPDHAAAHVAVQLALIHACPSPVCLTYMVHGVNGAARASAPACATAIPMSEREIARKLAAVGEHTSQLALSRGRVLRYAHRPERFTLERMDPDPLLSSHHVLPWNAGLCSVIPCEVLVVCAGGTWRIPLGSHERDTGCDPQHDAEHPSIRKGGAHVTLELPERLRTCGPVFAKLTSRVPSPWIYDRWGWIRLGVAAGQDPAQLRANVNRSCGQRAKTHFR